MYMAPKFRRRGIALSLFEEAFAWGRVRGCTEVDLNVLQNSPAKVLYESLGFEVFEIEMRRKL
nr:MULTISPECIES: GNAT family N-acetyltransferase [Nostocaceae]